MREDTCSTYCTNFLRLANAIMKLQITSVLLTTAVLSNPLCAKIVEPASDAPQWNRMHSERETTIEGRLPSRETRTKMYKRHKAKLPFMMKVVKFANSQMKEYEAAKKEKAAKSPTSVRGLSAKSRSESRAALEDVQQQAPESDPAEQPQVMALDDGPASEKDAEMTSEAKTDVKHGVESSSPSATTTSTSSSTTHKKSRGSRFRFSFKSNKSYSSN